MYCFLLALVQLELTPLKGGLQSEIITVEANGGKRFMRAVLRESKNDSFCRTNYI
jgi:hypothetical protein